MEQPNQLTLFFAMLLSDKEDAVINRIILNFASNADYLKTNKQ